MFGKLFIVSTPIGNLSDITQRAIETLSQVDVIAAEDTRHSRKLLEHYAIPIKQLISLHDYNETERTDYLLKQLKEGHNVALISDAGTPLISDPGFTIVRRLREAGCEVSPVPGPSALIAALCVSGLPTDRFCFEGFLPAKTGARQKRLKELANEERTLIFYESPHRILECLSDMISVLGVERKAVIARELTKRFETIKNETLENLYQWLQTNLEQQQGEFVVLVHGAEPSPVEVAEIKRVLNILLEELPLKQSVALAAKITGEKKNEVYELALSIRKWDCK